MDCLIPGANMRVVNRTIQALSKISDELYIEGEIDNLSFVAMNMNKTAYAKYTFHSIFFVNYKIEDGSDEKITCKIHMKSLLNVFKNKIDRKVEMCRILFDKDATQILFKLKYKQDIMVVHNLKLIDFDYLTIDYNTEDAKNNITGTGVFFNQILSNFQTSDSSLSLEVNSNKITLRNYDVGVSTVYKGMRSQIVLTGNEFDSYSIGEETNIVLSLKPFRSAISFGEFFNIPIMLHFKNGGWPIILRMKNTTFNVDYILATVNPDDSESQSTTTSEVLDPVLRCVQNRNNAECVNLSMEVDSSEKDLTLADKEAMESVNWDDNDFDNDVTMSPPITKRNVEKEKMANIFGRCFDPTFHTSMLDFGEELAPNSDSD
ncbi:PREDICTED: cell cycle checkpoint control protein RAD9A [Nicrophorus vespilloides]|uniref:Cell cycle checkpoint control protein RAD9A n=1 Tax=Nicrophorus vespilloides TaxID=110193 RepID=A0ABM1N2J4_NICVS|nr:PREDICTED: cell cycle checkpoint control protein RAD9A [Nicrophorus vespilloides]